MTATAVYRFYDTRGTLLYVGMTSDPWQRFAKQQYSEWAAYADPSRTRIRWYRTRRAAAAAEAKAIKSEHPVYNWQHNAAPPPAYQEALPLRWQPWPDFPELLATLSAQQQHDWFSLRYWQRLRPTNPDAA